MASGLVLACAGQVGMSQAVFKFVMQTCYILAAMLSVICATVTR